MKLRRLFIVSGIVFGIASAVLVGAGAAHADPKGLWLAQDGAKVRVANCGAALCAIIAAPKSPVDPQTGQPWTDKNNPDPARRTHSLVGLAVLFGLMPEEPGKWTGHLYNVDNGQVYQGHLIELGPRTIRVEGCAIGICGGQNMSRLQ
jgi:uncharacterized protein (DUF2147 family)